jgi:hypothetical protein
VTTSESPLLYVFVFFAVVMVELGFFGCGLEFLLVARRGWEKWAVLKCLHKRDESFTRAEVNLGNIKVG